MREILVIAAMSASVQGRMATLLAGGGVLIAASLPMGEPPRASDAAAE
jgi:hypothetical protein